MLEVPVYNTSGQQTQTLQVDEELFGKTVNAALLKQAIVGYHANKRQGTLATKNRGQVEGSTRKLFNQKHTGNARRGPIRTNIMRGGGMAFGKQPRDFRQGLPRQMRRKALESAILAKLLGQDLVVVEGLAIDSPKTKTVVDLLDALKINRSCLLTLAQRDTNIWKSARNIPDVTVRIAEELNAFDVATRQKLLVTLDAMKALLERKQA
jgi:large subunit ribosomal protein L4